MKKTVICLLLFGIGLTVSAQEKAETVSMRYETQNDMPLFYQKLKESLTYPMAWRNSSIRNFEKWREGARKVLLDCMQPAPPVAAFDKEVIEKDYTGKNDIKILRLANSLLMIATILLILYLKDFVLDMPYIINKQYSYAEGYVTEQSHGGADISSERRSVFLYDKVKDDEIEITVFSRYIDKNTYLKVQYLPHTKYGAIVEIK